MLYPRFETYVPMARTPSSKKIRAASIAYKITKSRHFHHEMKFVPLFTPPSRFVYQVTEEVIHSHHVVVDGSDQSSRTTLSKECSHTLAKPLLIISIRNNDIFVPKLSPQHVGLKYQSAKNLDVFCLCPRVHALTTTQLYRNPGKAEYLFFSFMAFEDIQKKSLKRGTIKPVFGSEKYVGSLGWQASRSSTGLKRTYHYKTDINKRAIDTVHSYVASLETLMLEYSSEDSVAMLAGAKDLLPWPTIGTCRYYSTIAFGRNIYLPVHTDQDFTYSITSVHKRLRIYGDDDAVVAYFCFPQLSIAVPIRPGDVIIFNPREPHCISSRCCYDDDIICLSVYLKSALIGGNDNSTIVGPEVSKISNQFHDISKKH